MNNPKTILILIITFFLSLAVIKPLSSQSISESLERELLTSQTLQNQQARSLNNEVFLIQVGDDNLANIFQNTQNSSGNSASIRQIGYSEEIILNQLGANNSMSINQYGSNNTTDISNIGNSISGNISQNGFGNGIQLELGSDKSNYNIQQQGYNHSLIDVGFNPKSQGYTIKQSGLAGMEIIIQQR